MTTEYRYLTEGEVIQAGDEFYSLSREWLSVTIFQSEIIGQPIRHAFRRPVEPQHDYRAILAELLQAEVARFYDSHLNESAPRLHKAREAAVEACGLEIGFWPQYSERPMAKKDI